MAQGGHCGRLPPFGGSRPCLPLGLLGWALSLRAVAPLWEHVVGHAYFWGVLWRFLRLLKVTVMLWCVLWTELWIVWLCHEQVLWAVS